MIIVLSGLIGTCQTGGQAWAYMQYLAGLRSRGGNEVGFRDRVCKAASGGMVSHQQGDR